MCGGAVDEEGRVCEHWTDLGGGFLVFFFNRDSFSSLATGCTAADAHESYLNMDKERLKLLWEQE
jgi:hypothetical protein